MIIGNYIWIKQGDETAMGCDEFHVVQNSLAQVCIKQAEQKTILSDEAYVTDLGIISILTLIKSVKQCPVTDLTERQSDKRNSRDSGVGVRVILSIRRGTR